MEPERLEPPAPIGVLEYRDRRRALMARIEADSAVLIAGATTRTRNRDSDYPFRQESHFHYLCGFPEPDAWLVLLPGREAGESVLFCLPRDPAAERWTGWRIGERRAVARYGVDEAWPLEMRDEKLLELLDGRRTLYLLLDDERAMTLAAEVRARLGVQRGRHPPQAFADIAASLAALRLIKSPAELALMAHAARISACAHRRAMQSARPGLYEYRLQGDIEHEFIRHGARSPAYATIVGGGLNACVLHYCENEAPLVEGELVLIDAGAEYGLYAGDITRTLPVSGRFSEPQRQLYEVVLGAQQRALRRVKPGISIAAIHEGVVADLTAGLVVLGLLDGPVESAIEQGGYRRFFPHATSHWLGLDVHDAGAMRDDRGHAQPLAPGMVLTVEPGLYVPDDPDIPAQWQGIGIRIEDDVAVTADGARVLTEAVPKSPVAIEALMQEAAQRRAAGVRP